MTAAVCNHISGVHCPNCTPYEAHLTAVWTGTSSTPDYVSPRVDHRLVATRRALRGVLRALDVDPVEHAEKLTLLGRVLLELADGA